MEIRACNSFQDLLEAAICLQRFPSVAAEGMINIQDEMDAEMLTLLVHLRRHGWMLTVDPTSGMKL